MAVEYGITDEVFGYFEALNIEQQTSGLVESMSGEGKIKSIKQFGPKSRVTGTYIYLDNDASIADHVGDGTAITLSDADSPGDIYIERHSYVKGAGSGTNHKIVNFEGMYYPDLT